MADDIEMPELERLWPRIGRENTTAVFLDLLSKRDGDDEAAVVAIRFQLLDLLAMSDDALRAHVATLPRPG